VDQGDGDFALGDTPEWVSAARVRGWARYVDGQLAASRAGPAVAAAAQRTEAAEGAQAVAAAVAAAEVAAYGLQV